MTPVEEKVEELYVALTVSTLTRSEMAEVLVALLKRVMALPVKEAKPSR